MSMYFFVRFLSGNNADSIEILGFRYLSLWLLFL